MHRRIWIALFLLSLTAINYIDRVTLSFAARPIAAEFHLSAVAMGYLFSAFLWTYTLGLIPIGALVDRHGPNKVVAWGIGLWSAATALTGLSWSFPALLGTRLAMGLGEATTNPAGARIIREWFPATERGLANAMFNGGAFAGPAICALAMGLLIENAGWRAAFALSGVIGFVWLAAWTIWYHPPERANWLTPGERDLILRRRGIVARPAAEGSAQAGTSGLPALLRHETLWALAVAQGCSAYCSYLFLTWLPSYLQAARHLTWMKTGFYTSLPYAIAMVLCLAVGRLSDRILAHRVEKVGARRYIVAGSMLTAAILLLIAPSISSVPLLLAVFTIALTCIATNTAQLFALLSDLLPNSGDLGKAMGFMVVGGNLFGLLAPIVTGYVVSVTGGYDWGFRIAGILSFVGMITCITLARRPIAARSIVSGPLKETV